MSSQRSDGAQLVAFRMQLRPGTAEEYKRRHDAIWPDLVDALEAAGIFDYCIFLEQETGSLFAVLRCHGPNKRLALANEPVVRRWWAHMADLMEVESDGKPVEWPLRQVFHLD